MLLGLRAKDALADQEEDTDDTDDTDDDKVTICHKPGTPAQKTKRVPQQALDGHLGHGDYEGPWKECPKECPETCDNDGKCPQCPGGCPEHSTCMDNDCRCDRGYKPGPNATCVPDGTGECPGKCFFMRTRGKCLAARRAVRRRPRGAAAASTRLMSAIGSSAARWLTRSAARGARRRGTGDALASPVPA